ncbi:hypothetical protein [Haloarcula pellucida]|uniref:Uncharacterized protein n=1 Tax=Haloarcula pellucida TaxID=1427151 RepID=A0A830GFD6_9EURY|nr:hypothetical protein [Halomicroarcula pellucida]MBX0346648.1 hypothetical protein [Halomicroarcula pellucida]GGN84773.1 hypothetical protein GCM10009030_00650 [Halomicroarcula pellucida]
MTDDSDANVIDRDALRAGRVECPLCGRQLVDPMAHAVVYGAVDAVTAENADAVECPVCDGVTFVVDD